MKEKITAFLPCRSGSERVPEKNTRRFGHFKNGLLELKLSQLTGVTVLDEIVVSSNDPIVLEISDSFPDSRVRALDRPSELCESFTSTDELIRYVPQVVPEGSVLWTHVTSPFINKAIYTNAVLEYQSAQNNGFDSLMSVTKVKDFIWFDGRVLNAPDSRAFWPRTQELKDFYMINSGIFINSVKGYRQFMNRIGKAPYLLPVSEISGIDIDWPEDFELAERLFHAKIGEI